MKQFLFVCLLFVAASIFAAASNVAIAPFTFAGRITDYAHVAYNSSAAVEVRLRDKDGNILAKTTTATSGNTTYNYVLYVPIALSKVPRYACVGDEVTFEFVDPSGNIYTGLVAQAESKIGSPGAVKRLDVVLATDSDGDGVADEYVESIAYWMALNGIDEMYDPKKDYDGDGRTNYEEYIAGTNPCDANDSFTIRQMTFSDGIDNYIVLRIPVAQGRAYYVKSTGNLVDEASWKAISFSEDSAAEPTSEYLTTGGTEVGYRTIFVKKNGTQQFYKIFVE